MTAGKLREAERAGGSRRLRGIGDIDTHGGIRLGGARASSHDRAERQCNGSANSQVKEPVVDRRS